MNFTQIPARQIFVLVCLLTHIKAYALCDCVANINGRSLPVIESTNESACLKQLLNDYQVVSCNQFRASDSNILPTLQWSCSKGNYSETKNYFPLCSDGHPVKQQQTNTQAHYRDHKSEPSLNHTLNTPGNSQAKLELRTNPFHRSKNKTEWKYSLPNDQALFGLPDAIKGSKTYGAEGYDENATHGMSISFNLSLANDYHLTAEYSSMLYTNIIGTTNTNLTRDEQGVAHIVQDYLEKNTFKIEIDNRDKKSPVFFSLALGSIVLNETKMGTFLFSSLRQQQGFHQLQADLGRDIVVYENLTEPFVSDDAELLAQSNQNPKKYRKGLFLKLGAGVTGTVHRTPDFEMSGGLELEISASNLDISTQKQTAIGYINFDFLNSADSYSYRVGAKLTYDRYPQDNISNNSIALNFDIATSNTFFCSFIVSKRSEDEGPSYLNYDHGNDNFYTLECLKRY